MRAALRLLRPPTRRYALFCEVSGQHYVFTARPEPRHIADALHGLCAFGLSDVCADALAYGVCRAPVARYGPCWTLREEA